MSKRNPPGIDNRFDEPGIGIAGPLILAVVLIILLALGVIPALCSR